MKMMRIARYVLMIACLAVILCLVLWFAVPLILLAWELLFPSYDHEVAVLPYDIECHCVSPDGSSEPIVLPKGLMIYSPCSHDFSRMSLDENAVYKVYLRLDPKTIEGMCKNSDKDWRKLFLKAKRFGEIEQVLPQK